MTSQRCGESHSFNVLSQPPDPCTQVPDPARSSGTCAQSSGNHPPGNAKISCIEPYRSMVSSQGSEHWQESSPVLTPLEWQKKCSVTELQRLEETFLCLDDPMGNDTDNTEISNEANGWQVSTTEYNGPKAGDIDQYAEDLCLSHQETELTTQHDRREGPFQLLTGTDNSPTTHTHWVDSASFPHAGTKVTAKQFLAKNRCDTCGGPIAKPQDAKHLSEKVPKLALWCHPNEECWSGGMDEALADPFIQSELSRLPGDTAISYRLVKHGLPRHKRGKRRDYTGTRQKNRVISSHVFCPCVICGTRVFWGQTHYIGHSASTPAVMKPTKARSMICRACG